jgi:hypothetical protein
MAGAALGEAAALLVLPTPHATAELEQITDFIYTRTS